LTTAWYTSPNGNDEGPGTYQQPFKTLKRALEVAADDGDHVVMLRGTYYGILSEIDFKRLYITNKRKRIDNDDKNSLSP
jgi:hypothetical protein